VEDSAFQSYLRLQMQSIRELGLLEYVDKYLVRDIHIFIDVSHFYFISIVSRVYIVVIWYKIEESYTACMYGCNDYVVQVYPSLLHS